MPDARDEVGLANTRRPEGEHVVPLCKPAVSFGQGSHVSFRDRRHSVEVEAGQALVWRQTAVDAGACQAACLALVDLLLQ